MNSHACLALLAALALAGCATAPPAPVIVRCTPTLPPEPAYPDTDDALATADIVPAVQMLMAGRELRAARIQTLKAALAACAG